MKNSRHSLIVGLASLIGALVSSCAPGGHLTVEQPTVERLAVEQPTYLAQSAVAECLPRDSSMVCCIKKFPLTPAESCGATAVEVAEVLNGAKVLNEALQPVEGKAMEHQEGDWHEIRVLDTRIQQGEALELTAGVCDLLRRTAPTVGLGEAEAETALTHVESAIGLVHRMRERIRDGSNRIVDALHRMSRLRKKGDIEGARQQMRDVLAVEVVPHYREIAESQLAELDELP